MELLRFNTNRPQADVMYLTLKSNQFIYRVVHFTFVVHRSIEFKFLSLSLVELQSESIFFKNEIN